MSCSSIKEILLIYGQLARFIEEHKSDLYKMDIRSYFGSTSQASSDAKADSDSVDHGTDSSDPKSSPSPPPSKKVCKSSKNKRYHRSVSTKRNTRRAGRRISVGCTMMRIAKEPLQDLQAIWNFWSSAYWRGGSQNPSKIGRKLLKKRRLIQEVTPIAMQPKLCWQLKELWWMEQLYSNSRMLKLTKGLRTELQ